MFKCGKEKKEQSIRDILILLNKMPHYFNRPDLDQWRRLTIPTAQLKALFLIVNGHEVNFRTLAEDLEVTPGNVTGIVDRLGEQDLVVRKPDPQDRRVIWLEATDKGKELLNRLIEDHSKQFAIILEHMKADDVAALRKGLDGLIKALEEHIGELNRNRTIPLKG